VFAAGLGLTAADAPTLKAKLEEAARSGDAKRGERDLYGQRYTVDFDLATKQGTASIRSAWIVTHRGTAPRLTTCYVKKRKG